MARKRKRIYDENRSEVSSYEVHEDVMMILSEMQKADVRHERQGYQANTYNGESWLIDFARDYKTAERKLEEQLERMEAQS